MSNCDNYVSEEDIRALKESGQHIEHVARSRDSSGSKALSVTDTIRGESVTNRTLDGLEELYQNALSNIGYQQMGDYTTGITINGRNQIVFYDGSWYIYRGDLPHVTTGATLPEDGGIWSDTNPNGKWVDVGDAGLRRELNSSIGANLVKTSGGESVQDALNSITGYHKLRNEGNVEGWRNEYPDDTDCINAALSSGAAYLFTDPERGTYNIRSGVLYTRKYQTFDCSKAKVKRIDSDQSRKNLIEMDDYSTLIGEVDGNYQNNIADAGTWTGLDSSVPFAQNVFMGRMHTSTTGTKLATGCAIPYLNSYNAIRSCIVVCGSNHSIDKLVLADSYTDHWCYFSAVSNSLVNEITASGHCRAEGVSFGTDENSVATGIKVGIVRIKNPTYTNFSWYKLPPRYLAARWNSHSNIEIGTINITDTTKPVISDELQIHRRLAIYESDSPMKIGSINIKTIIAPSRSLVTVENNSAEVTSINCEYIADTNSTADTNTSVFRATGAAIKPVAASVGQISVKGDGKGSRIAMSVSAKIAINSVVGLPGATNFGRILYAASGVRDSLISVQSWSGPLFFEYFADMNESNGMSAIVDLISSTMSTINVVGNQVINNPGSNLLAVKGDASAIINRLRYFTPGKVITLIGDGNVTIQKTTYMVNKTGDIKTVANIPYAYLISANGKAYQL